MEREIKFRAWCPKQLEMYDPFTLEEAINFSGPVLNRKDDVIMQFTGLYDKHGKEIYEGDILKTVFNTGLGLLEKKGEMKWIQTSARFVIDSLVDSSWNFTENLAEQPEIIGNIYENPELLSN